MKQAVFSTISSIFSTGLIYPPCLRKLTGGWMPVFYEFDGAERVTKKRTGVNKHSSALFIPYQREAANWSKLPLPKGSKPRKVPVKSH